MNDCVEKRALKCLIFSEISVFFLHQRQPINAPTELKLPGTLIIVQVRVRLALSRDTPYFSPRQGGDQKGQIYLAKKTVHDDGDGDDICQ